MIASVELDLKPLRGKVMRTNLHRMERGVAPPAQRDVQTRTPPPSAPSPAPHIHDEGCDLSTLG